MAFARGWTELRTDDCGLLWEHLVLDTLRSLPAQSRVHFWRDKQQREVDFVVARGRGVADAIECKWTPTAFDSRGLRAFRALHPRGRNLLVTPQPGDPHERRLDGLEVTVAGAGDLRRLLG